MTRNRPAVHSSRKRINSTFIFIRATLASVGIRLAVVVCLSVCLSQVGVPGVRPGPQIWKFYGVYKYKRPAGAYPLSLFIEFSGFVGSSFLGKIWVWWGWDFTSAGRRKSSVFIFVHPSCFLNGEVYTNNLAVKVFECRPKTVLISRTTDGS